MPNSGDHAELAITRWSAVITRVFPSTRRSFVAATVAVISEINAVNTFILGYLHERDRCLAWYHVWLIVLVGVAIDADPDRVAEVTPTISLYKIVSPDKKFH